MSFKSAYTGTQIDTNIAIVEGIAKSKKVVGTDASGNIIDASTTAPDFMGINILGLFKIGTTLNKFGQISSEGGPLASSGYIDLNLEKLYDDTYFGILIVANKDANDINTRTNSVFIITVIGTALTSYTLHTANGATNPAAFTVTIPSNSKIRITNTYAYPSSTTAMFIGLNIR